MSTQADELLAAAQEIDAYDGEEGHIVVGKDRYITVPERLKRLGVQHDHNVETVTFDCPRYWDDLDMSKMKIYINFIRADREPGNYPVKSPITIDENDPDIMHFDWTISREITEAMGHIVFLVCIKKTDDEGEESNHWNSELCKDCYISEGLETMGNAVSEYPDLITHLLTRMDIVEEKTTLKSMLGYLDTYFTTDAEINDVLKNYVETFLDTDEDVTKTIADTVNTYIEEHLSATDKTLTVSDMPADAAATGDAIKNIVRVTNDAHLTDSVAGGLKLNKIYGKSEQTKLSGKNLVKLPDHDELTSNGITWACKNGVVTAKGTSTSISGTAGNIDYLLPIVAGDYYISGNVSNVSVLVSIQKSNGSYTWPTNRTFTLDGSEINARVYLQVASGETVDCTIYPMLNLGSTALPWEPYCGGIPAPNPDYPQEIKSAGDSGSIGVKVVGKNLLNLPNRSATEVQGVTWSCQDGIVTASGTAADDAISSSNACKLRYYMPIVAGTYTMKLNASDSGVKLSVRVTDANGKRLYPSSPFTLDGTETEWLIYFFVDKATTVNATVYPMLNAGTESLPWEPYTEQPLSISAPNGLPGFEVYHASFANYIDENGKMWCCDEIDVERGVYVKRVQEKIFDGSDATGWLHVSTYGTALRFDYTKSGVKPASRILSNRLLKIAISTPDIEGINVHSTDERIQTQFLASRLETADVNGLMTYFATNPLQLVYMLETPIETPLTDDEIIAAHSLKTCDGSTHIFTDSEVEPTIEVEYGTSAVGALSLENSNLHVVNKLLVENEISEIDGSQVLSTSILEKALTLSKGVYNFHIDGSTYTGGDLPNDSYRYSSATIYVRHNTSITVVLYGNISANVATPMSYNYFDANGWSGWKTYATKDDIDYINLNLVNGQHWYGDFNTVTTTCRLSVGDPASCSNIPSGASYGTLEVQKHGTYTTQTYIDIKDNNTQWVRASTNSGSSWTGWTEYATKDEVDSVTKQLGSIKYKSITRTDESHNIMDTLKAHWESLDLSSIYLVRINAGSQAIALVQKYKAHTHGAACIFRYGNFPVYMRISNGEWVEESKVLTSADFVVTGTADEATLTIDLD